MSSNNENADTPNQNYYSQKKPNNYPLLISSESDNNNIKSSTKKKTQSREEKKINNGNKKKLDKTKIKNNFVDISKSNDAEIYSNRKFQTENQKLTNESKEFKKDQGNNDRRTTNYDKTENPEDNENEETEEEKQKKKQEKINNEYDKYEINQYKSEGNNTNEIGSLVPSKCLIILRIILYNFIRPIYIYLLIIGILLCIPTYSDLPVIISMVIYLIMICTSIVIEIVEEIKGQNRLLLFNEKTKYKKITDNNILDIPGNNIQNGDIIVVKNEDQCPCDMIIIDSSANEIPLYFQSDTLTGNFNFNVRLIKNDILNKFIEIKNKFNPKFAEFIKSMKEEELEKMIEEQNKVRQSEKVYRDFLERNELMNEQEKEEKEQQEKQKKLNELKYDPNNKIYEEIKNQEYYKTISENILKGYYYIPKERNNPKYYLSLKFNDENNDLNNINNILEINEKNMCFCGEKVKNGMWIIGIVVHTGQEVKPLNEISQDFGSFCTYYKKRKTVFETEINYYFYILLTILSFLSIVAGVVNMIHMNVLTPGLYSNEDKNRHPTSPTKNFYHSFLDYICLMHSMIPYSIFFTLEIVLLFQKIFINSDIDLLNKNKDIITDSKQIKDLGKVDLILTDKTGTLTKNERYFKYCVIADGCYEYRNSENQSSLQTLSKNYNKALIFGDYDMINSSSYRKIDGIIDSVQYDGYIVSSKLYRNICIYLDRTEKIIEEFWKGIALCHDAIPVFNKSNLYGDYYLEEENKKKQKYFSNSGDNTTLVEMASKQGFTFYMDEKNTSKYMGDGTPTKENNQFYNLEHCDCEIILGEPGTDTEKIVLPIKKLCHIKFNSQRKRESVIVQDGDYIKLYVKGPIDDILPRIIEDNTPKKLISKSIKWLRAIESTGCRAFAVAMRILSPEEYSVFLDCFKEAHEDKVETKKRVNKVIDSIESYLTLLGGSFIEDLLPPKIKDAVSNIKNAGIKIWTVTGDKVSSTYNVGIATGIIDSNNDVIVAEINQDALIEKETKIQNDLLSNLKKRLNKKKDEKEKNNEEEKEKKEKEKEIEKKKKIQKQLENVLKSFEDEFRKMQNDSPLFYQANTFDIVIDALSFREISRTPKNLKSFFDKALLANSMTFCEFNSNDKKLLVQHFRNYIKDIKNINSYTILGVGDGFNDIEMLNEVDIGVGINNGINKYTKIYIDNFVDLSRLIMFHGINNLKRNTGIVELLIVRHFMFGFIFFLYGCHCLFSNVHIIPTQDIYICFFILNLIGPFLKGIFDINVFYFYDKKEKIKNGDGIDIKSNNSDDNKNEDKNEEIEREKKEKKERIQNRMFKNIFDHSFKYIYYQKNISLIESGSEHIPYKKYISINKFIILIAKSIFFCLINFYVTYGAVEAGHNIIDLNGNMIDFRRLQIILWTNNSFIIFLENAIFTYFYTIFRIIEIIIFVIIYIVILFLYQKQNTNQSNPISSFLLFLDFLVVVSFCSYVNFCIYISDNLFDTTVIYKLRNMKISEKYLEEMKQLVDYKEEEMEEDDDELEKERKKKEEEEKKEVIGIDNESEDEKQAPNFDFFNNNVDVSTTNRQYNDGNNNSKNNTVTINRKTKKYPKNYYNKINDDPKMKDSFNKNFIGRKEIKNSELVDSINLMNENRLREKNKENEQKAELKYVVGKNEPA